MAEARLTQWEEGYSLGRDQRFWTNKNSGEIIWEDPHQGPTSRAMSATGPPTFEVENPLPNTTANKPPPTPRRPRSPPILSPPASQRCEGDIFDTADSWQPEPPFLEISY